MSAVGLHRRSESRRAHWKFPAVTLTDGNSTFRDSKPSQSPEVFHKSKEIEAMFIACSQKLSQWQARKEAELEKASRTLQNTALEVKSAAQLDKRTWSLHTALNSIVSLKSQSSTKSIDSKVKKFSLTAPRNNQSRLKTSGLVATALVRSRKHKDLPQKPLPLKTSTISMRITNDCSFELSKNVAESPSQRRLA